MREIPLVGGGSFTVDERWADDVARVQWRSAEWGVPEVWGGVGFTITTYLAALKGVDRAHRIDPSRHDYTDKNLTSQGTRPDGPCVPQFGFQDLPEVLSRVLPKPAKPQSTSNVRPKRRCAAFEPPKPQPAGPFVPPKAPPAGPFELPIASLPDELFTPSPAPEFDETVYFQGSTPESVGEWEQDV